MAQSGCGLAAVLGVVGRSLSDSSRPLGLGIVTAFAGAGQFVVVPIGQAFLTHYGWSISFLLLGLMSTIIIFTAYFLRSEQREPPPPLTVNQACSPGPILLCLLRQSSLPQPSRKINPGSMKP